MLDVVHMLCNLRKSWDIRDRATFGAGCGAIAEGMKLAYTSGKEDQPEAGQRVRM